MKQGKEENVEQSEKVHKQRRDIKKEYITTEFFITFN